MRYIIMHIVYTSASDDIRCLDTIYVYIYIYIYVFQYIMFYIKYMCDYVYDVFTI